MIVIRVFGTPAPKGSMKLVEYGKGKRRLPRPIMVADNSHELQAWSRAVATCARVAMIGKAMYVDTALAVRATFILPRPASVKRLMPSVRPDLDKLIRSTLDAMTGVVFDDDARIVRFQDPTKVYDGWMDHHGVGAIINVSPFFGPDHKEVDRG